MNTTWVPYVVSVDVDLVRAAAPPSAVVTSTSNGAYISATWRQTSWIQACSAALKVLTLPSLS